MRIVVLSIMALVSFYALLPEKKDGLEIDDIKVKLSGPAREEKRLLPKPRPLAAPAPATSPDINESFVPEDGQESDPESDLSSIPPEEDDNVSQVEESHENDQEKNWQDELGQVLANLEPEYGEEIFNSYVNERSSFQSSLEDLIRTNQKNQDLEELISELETRHEERVKEIFGRHYEEIKALETKFLESEAP